jgi:hypothetical protein
MAEASFRKVGARIGLWRQTGGFDVVPDMNGVEPSPMNANAIWRDLSKINGIVGSKRALS